MLHVSLVAYVAAVFVVVVIVGVADSVVGMMYYKNISHFGWPGFVFSGIFFKIGCKRKSLAIKKSECNIARQLRI